MTRVAAEVGWRWDTVVFSVLSERRHTSKYSLREKGRRSRRRGRQSLAGLFLNYGGLPAAVFDVGGQPSHSLLNHICGCGPTGKCLSCIVLSKLNYVGRCIGT
jgi:hypothetical protein